MSSTTEQVGRVIGGRYRLLALVGSGASAQVFAADDARLARRVALKLLHPQLAGDATFLRKFQAEARLAASLNHRNVLHIYDWGDEDGVPYLVLEFLGGGSLRALLDTGFRLSPEQAAAVGAQAASGLAYAHRRGLVHRDVKPANLLFDDDGRLCVADFGLARALAEAAITEPLGTVLGTARYASPEQVEGGTVDERTDVYSLALTLYEAVTGRVPFAGDTTVATLMARVGAVLPPARELGPLAPVLAQAAISEPLARLDAAALADELSQLAGQLKAPAPLPLVRMDLGLAEPAADRDPTERFAAAVRTEPAAARPTADVGERPAPPAPAPVRARPVAQPTTVLPGVRRVPTTAGVPAPPAPPRRRHRLLVWLLVVLLVELAGGGYLFYRHRTVVHYDGVPAVVGLGAGTARAEITRAGLYPELVGERYSGTAPAGQVLSQHPVPGRVKAGSIVQIVISEGRHPTVLPRLVGLAIAKARGELRAAHLVGVFYYHYNETRPAGEVIGESAVKGPRVFYGSAVDVVVSKGPRPQVVPIDLSGGVVNWTQAQSALADLGLDPVEDPQYSTTVPSGYVVTTRPAPGAVVPGHSAVTVVVSLGPPFVKVPELFGDSAAVAEQTLTSLGLKWTLFGPPTANFVLTTIPSVGHFVEVGSTVDVYLY